MIDSTGFLSSDKISRAQLFSFFKSLQNSKFTAPKINAVGVLAFFEPSTRTQMSFEKAGLDLGIRWMHLEPEDSSLKKGESLEDTFKTLSIYKPQFFVVRHSSTGLPQLVNEWTGLPVLNAGEGQRDHPTQGLLDAYTLWERNQSKKYKVAFFGDVARSRVARADIHFFKLLGYQISVVDDGSETTKLFAKAFKLRMIPRKNLKNQDVVVALRTQKERGSKLQHSPLSREDLGTKTLLMHPGPVMIGEDLTHELCDFGAPQSLIYRQLENGLKVRRRLLFDLCEQIARQKK